MNLRNKQVFGDSDRRVFLRSMSGMMLGAAALPLFGQTQVGRSGVVKTAAGPVRGIDTGKVQIFTGIPYGGPVDGAGRFLMAKKPQPWTLARDTVRYGPRAVQLSDPNGGDPLWNYIESPTDTTPDSENCLFLNVWTPATDNAKRPVMFWIHGGGYAGGSGSHPFYQGTDVARNSDVVVVTVNHRLNVFGYLYLGEKFGGPYAEAANVGQLDLVLALEWVRDNIAEFGGDAANVTIWGQSGGGGKVRALLTMPAAKGLFHRAIIQSGAGLRLGTKEQGAKTADTFLGAVGASRPEQLRDLSTEAIFKASRTETPGMGGYGPVVDGTVIPQHPFDPAPPAISDSIPILLGADIDEVTYSNRQDPELYSMDEAGMRARVTRIQPQDVDQLIETYRKVHPKASPSDLYIAIASDRAVMNAITLAERKIARKAAPVYMYWFCFRGVMLGGKLRAPHGMENVFVFDHPGMAPFSGTDPARFQVADNMSQAWATFARKGDPSHNGIPKWPAYTLEKRATMLFDKTCIVANDPVAEQRKAWRPA